VTDDARLELDLLWLRIKPEVVETFDAAGWRPSTPSGSGRHHTLTPASSALEKHDIAGKFQTVPDLEEPRPARLALAPPTPVKLTPDPQDLPGSNVIQHLANGLDSWALIAAMVGVVIGAVIWGCTQQTIRKPLAT
jgi:hypothetical protein